MSKGIRNRDDGGRRVMLAALSLLAVLAGCNIADPELPSFDTRVNLPLGSEVLTVSEAVDDDSTLVSDPDGGIRFVTGGDPETIDLDQDLEASVPSQILDQTIGTFTVAAPDPVRVDETLAEAWPEAAALAGTTAPVPAFSFTVETAGLDLSGVEEVVLEAGDLTCAVTSTWPVAISGAGTGDPLLLTLSDAGSGSELLTVPLGPVPAGGAVQATVSLSGLTLPDRITASVSGHGDGSAEPVAITGEENLGIELSFSGLSASSATAAVPAQEFTLDFTADLGDGDEISSATVGSGSVSFQLQSGLPLEVAVDLVWDQVRTPGGDPLSASATVPAGGSAVVTVPFSGCTIVSDGESLTALTARAQARTPGSGGASVTLSSTQGLTIDLAPGVFSFTEVSGCFAPDSWDLEPVTEQITYPDDSEGIAFTQAALVLELVNSAYLGADLDLTLTGIPRQGDPVYLEVHEFVDGAAGDNAKTTLVLDERNSELVDFLNSRPETISLAGTAAIPADANCGTVRAGDTMEVSWELSVPLVVNIEGATIDGDPSPLGLDEDLRSAISDHAGAAELRTVVTNHLPAGLRLWVLVADRAEDLPDAPLLTVGPLTVDPAAVDPLTGEVSGGVVSRPVIELTPEESRIFGRPGLHTMFRAEVPAGEGGPVRLLTTDYLEVTGMLAMDLRIDEEL